MAAAADTPRTKRVFFSAEIRNCGMTYTNPVDYSEALAHEERCKADLDYWSRNHVVTSATITKTYIPIPGGEGKWIVSMKGLHAKSPGEGWHFAGVHDSMAIFYKDVEDKDVEDKDVE